jgi:predicted amidohydrolase YtcJ
MPGKGLWKGLRKGFRRVSVRAVGAAWIATALVAGLVMAQAPRNPAQGRPGAPNKPREEPADIILYNGAIWTGDPAKPRISALAIRGETIVAAGTLHEMEPFDSPETRRIDLHGRFAMPGFNDAHVHLFDGGFAKIQINFEGTKSIAEFQQRIREHLTDYAAGEWITGQGWDHTLWEEKRFPTRDDLDAVAKDRPMYFERIDGHVAVANTKALQIARITAKTPDPPGGHIMHDPKTGEPNGMLEEDAAMNLVFQRIPPVSPEKWRRAVELGLADLAQHGVTSVQDYSPNTASKDPNALPETVAIYQQLKKEGKLTARIFEWLSFDLPVARLEKFRQEIGTDDPWLKTGGLKAFMDGSLGSRTAAMYAPYSDESATKGILRVDPAKLKQQAIERDRAGFQLLFHAIGDRGNGVALDTFAAAAAANGARDRRDRVEHAQVVAPDDFARFASLNVIASMQPSHLLDDQRWADARLGAERVKGAYAWRTMQDHGVRLAFGTDYPVEPINPLRGIYECITRELPDGSPEGGWQPQEKLPIADCLRNYTAGSAYAEFEEQRKGTLATGMLADVVVYPQDITRMAAADLLNLPVWMTIAGGRVVYEAEPRAPKVRNSAKPPNQEPSSSR